MTLSFLIIAAIIATDLSGHDFPDMYVVYIIVGLLMLFVVVGLLLLVFGGRPEEDDMETEEEDDMETEEEDDMETEEEDDMETVSSEKFSGVGSPNTKIGTPGSPEYPRVSVTHVRKNIDGSHLLEVRTDPSIAVSTIVGVEVTEVREEVHEYYRDLWLAISKGIPGRLLIQEKVPGTKVKVSVKESNLFQPLSRTEYIGRLDLRFEKGFKAQYEIDPESAEVEIDF